MTLTYLNYTSEHGYELTRSHKHDAGLDIRSSESRLLVPGARHDFATGIHLEIPAGYEAQVRTRSGMALRDGACVLNAPGTIDSGYTGEVKIILHNPSLDAVSIKEGDKIAQIVVKKVELPTPILHELLNIETERGDNGFGSTGK